MKAEARKEEEDEEGRRRRSKQRTGTRTFAEVFDDLELEILMTEDNQKRLIIYVADIALGDQRCDVEQLFGASSRGSYSRKAGRSGAEELDLDRIIDVLRAEPFHIFDYPAAFDENELKQVLRRAYNI